MSINWIFVSMRLAERYLTILPIYRGDTLCAPQFTLPMQLAVGAVTFKRIKGIYTVSAIFDVAASVDLSVIVTTNYLFLTDPRFWSSNVVLYDPEQEYVYGSEQNIAAVLNDRNLPMVLCEYVQRSVPEKCFRAKWEL